MSDDWAGVARAITQRMDELGMRQREVAERSRVSQAIIRELQHNTVQRKRNTRTLEALSVAMDWPPGYLAALLRGRQPPTTTSRDDLSTDPVSARLEAVEGQLAGIADRLDGIDKRLEILGDDTSQRTQ
ncbi:MAG: XRE family transcriptional regulator [Pseudonocardiaceae bacterium]|nr:XRE family transcriptional regulator [Pseudonocardiaceae bacterium]